MVVEHEFVTTLDATAALSMASRFLNEGGFVGHDAAFVVGQTEWTTLEMKRGKKAGKAKNIAELPQRLILNFDRGRITVAASIAASHVWGGNSHFAIGFGSESATESPKRMELHQRLLIAIANGLEGVIAKGQAPEVARADWLETERLISEAARKRIRRNWIIAGVIVLIFASLITLAVVLGGR